VLRGIGHEGVKRERGRGLWRGTGRRRNGQGKEGEMDRGVTTTFRPKLLPWSLRRVFTECTL
jgi:hypothetical protein